MFAGVKAFVFQDGFSLDALRLVERPLPTPGRRDILLRMRAVSLNHRDVLIARGEYGAYPLPRVPVSDGAGEVVATGVDVSRFAVGDLVCPVYVPDWVSGPVQEAASRRRLGGPVDGVLAEYLCVHEGEAVRAPRHLDAHEASTLPIAAVTVFQALFVDAALPPGSTVAVQGTGGVSLFAILLARAAGARVLSLVRGLDRRVRLERLGSEVIDVSQADWEEEVRRATRGCGVDVFVDVAGGAGLNRSVSATRVGGTVVCVGFVRGTSACLDLVAMIRRAVTLRTVSGGSRDTFEALVRCMESNAIRPVMDRIFPFADVLGAYRHLAEGRPFGKVVVTLFQESSSVS